MTACLKDPIKDPGITWNEYAKSEKVEKYNTIITKLSNNICDE